MHGLGGGPTTTEPAIAGANGYEVDELDARRYEEINLQRQPTPAQDYDLGIRVLEQVAFTEGAEALDYATALSRPAEEVDGWIGIHARLGLVRRELRRWGDELERPGWYITPLGDRTLIWLPDAPPSRAMFAEAVRRASIRLRRAA